MLSIVVVNHNGGSCIHECINSLRECTTDADFEILIVDSGSTDDSWDGLEIRYPNVRVLRHESNIGFCAGCNRGAEAAFGDILAFVNFDGVVEHAWDAPLLKALRDPMVSVAGGMLVSSDGSSVEAVGLAVACNMATFGLDEGLPRADVAPVRRKVTAVSGALMAVRKIDFLACGGFNEHLWMYGDEIDLCLRLGGTAVVDPRSVLRHEMGHAAGSHFSALRVYWSSRNRLINARRHLPPRLLALSVIASAAFDGLAIVSTRRRDVATAVFRGWRDGLRAMPRERNQRSESQRLEASEAVLGLGPSVRQFVNVRRLRRTG